MGASESKHSTRSDVVPNLHWSLNELMLWRQRADEDILAEQQASRMYARSGIVAPGSGIGEIPTRDQREVGIPLSTLTDTNKVIGDIVTPTFTTSATTSTVSIESKVKTQSLEAQVEVDRSDSNVIREKYLFILDHVEKLVQAAEQNYMAICKESCLKSLQSKVNTSLASGPTTKADLEQRINENNALLLKDLGDWDNARGAILWLERHFDLLVQRRMLSREITHISDRIQVLQTEVPSQDSLDEIRHLRSRLGVAHEGVGSAKAAAKHLQRDSLVVGLQYLDFNQSGSIEPADQPQLRSELFSRLDVRHKHRITPADLQAAIAKMEKRVEQYQQRVIEAEADLTKCTDALHSYAADPNDSDKKRLRIEQLNVEIKKKQDVILQLRQEKAREKTFLRDTYGMFQRAFVESLFAKLGQRRVQDKAIYDAYNAEMPSIERNINNLHIAADQGSKGLETTSASQLMLGCMYPTPLQNTEASPDKPQFMQSTRGDSSGATLPS